VIPLTVGGLDDSVDEDRRRIAVLEELLGSLSEESVEVG